MMQPQTVFCDECRAPIDPDQASIKRVVGTADGRRTFRFHADCYAHLPEGTQLRLTAAHNDETDRRRRRGLGAVLDQVVSDWKMTPIRFGMGECIHPQFTVAWQEATGLLTATCHRCGAVETRKAD